MVFQDLVKTHLMYAVREEVELLRGKIVELETKVLFLERENSLLREHVPPEILAKLLLPASATPAAVISAPQQPQLTAGTGATQPPSSHQVQGTQPPASQGGT